MGIIDDQSFLFHSVLQSVARRKKLLGPVPRMGIHGHYLTVSQLRELRDNLSKIRLCLVI